MGRYLKGTAGFRYKYLVGEQPDNLIDLAEVSGAGASGLCPVFVAWNSEADISTMPCAPLIAMACRELGERGERKAFAHVPGEVVQTRTLEFLQYALGESIVVVARELDAWLPKVPHALYLSASAAYQLTREQWPAMFEYVQTALTTAKKPTLESLDALRSRVQVDAAWNALGTHDEGCAAMALWILAHAVQHDLPLIEVSEIQPSRNAERFWSGVTEWGPEIFARARLPTDVDELFARGLTFYLNQEDNHARSAFIEMYKQGDPRALRWLKAAGVGDLEIAVLSQSQAPLDPPDVRAARRRARADAEFELYRALRSEEAIAIADAVVRAAGAGLRIEEKTLQNVPSKVINAGLSDRWLPVFRALQLMADGTHPDPIFAYNMTCLAARAGLRDEVLTWTETALARGEKGSELYDDADLQSYRNDAAWVALLGLNQKSNSPPAVDPNQGMSLDQMMAMQNRVREILREGGDLSQALAIVEMTLRAFPKSTHGLQLRVMVLERLGSPALLDALAAQFEAGVVAPGNPSVHTSNVVQPALAYANALLAQQRVAEAIDVLERGAAVVNAESAMPLRALRARLR